MQVAFLQHALRPRALHPVYRPRALCPVYRSRALRPVHRSRPLCPVQVEFLKHALRPGDPGYQHDVKVGKGEGEGLG
jgi:hypothetical protein